MRNGVLFVLILLYVLLIIDGWRLQRSMLPKARPLASSLFPSSSDAISRHKYFLDPRATNILGLIKPGLYNSFVSASPMPVYASTIRRTIVAAAQSKEGQKSATQLHSQLSSVTMETGAISAGLGLGLLRKNWVNVVGLAFVLGSVIFMFSGNSKSQPVKVIRQPRPSFSTSSSALSGPRQVFPALSTEQMKKFANRRVEEPAFPVDSNASIDRPGVNEDISRSSSLDGRLAEKILHPEHVKPPVAPLDEQSTSMPSHAVVIPAPSDQELHDEAIPTPAKPSILQRFFKGVSNTSGRAATLSDAFQRDHLICRLFIASFLSRLLPANFARIITSYLNTQAEEIESNSAQALKIADFVACVDNQDALAYLLKSFEEEGLVLSDAAEVFADVVNAVIVHVVDAIGTATNSHTPEEVLAQLDSLVEFIDQVGTLFDEVFTGLEVAPIQYNGNMSKKQLEALFVRYMKSSAAVPDLMSMMQAGEGVGQGVEDGSAGIKSMEKRQEGLSRLQFLLSIKDSRRGQLEQKAMLDMVMAVGKGLMKQSGGSGGGGGIGGLLKSLGQGGAGSGMPAMPGMLGGGLSMEQMAKQLEQLGLGDGAVPGMGADLDKMLKDLPPDVLQGMPDISKMDPTEMMKYSQQTVAMVSAPNTLIWLHLSPYLT